MKKKKTYKYKLPLIIKEALGEDAYNQMSEVIKNNTEEREFVIWASPEFIDAINAEIDKELKNKYNFK